MARMRRQYGRRCSWCFKEGHNKRTCPAYTAHLKKIAEKHGGHSLVMYVKRTGEMPDGSKPTGELAAVKETAKKESKRRCSWCVKMKMAGGGKTMVKMNGKMVPDYAVDGKGPNDLKK